MRQEIILSYQILQKNVYKARNEENVHLKCIYKNPLTVILAIMCFYIDITLDVIKLRTFSNFMLF